MTISAVDLIGIGIDQMIVIDMHTGVVGLRVNVIGGGDWGWLVIELKCWGWGKMIGYSCYCL